MSLFRQCLRQAVCSLLCATPFWAHADVDGTCTDELLIGRDAGSGMRWELRSDLLGNLAQINEGGTGWGSAREALSVAVGDVDGDGLDEFAVGRDGAAGQSVRVLVFDDANQNFTQIFSGGNDWGAGRRATAIAFGNVDDDPALEMAVGRDGPNNFRWRIYDDRLASFSALATGGTSWGTDRTVTALSFGDVDGDGRDELVVGRTGGTVARPRWVVIDDANAGFAELIAGGADWGAGRRVHNLATGDVDGDGRDEILIGRDSGANFKWQLRDDAVAGFGVLTSGGQGWGSTRSARAVGMGDVDGDSMAELVIGRNGGIGPRVLIFDDAGQNFQEIGRKGDSWGVTRGVRAIALGDPDGDRVDEIAVGRNGGANDRWFLYNDRFTRFETLAQGGDGWGVGRAVNALALRDRPARFADRDGDGLFDDWEDFGIDADCDGTVDFTPPNSDPDRANIYVEMDFMQGHRPRTRAVADTIAAFTNAPWPNPVGPNGIDLTIDVDEQIPEQLDITTWVDFDTIRDASFGTAAERASPNANNVLRAKSWVYRYALMAHTRDGGTSSGRAKPGNFVVTLGGSPWGTDAAGNNVGTRAQQAGTIMHELGHTLGLGHGGGDNVNCKPNYLSVMSYTFQTRLIPNPTLPRARLDYSRSALPDLNEGALDESVGIQDGTDQTRWGDDGTVLRQAPGTGPIDWNRNGITDPGAVSADTNNTTSNACGASPGQTLFGFDDWANLFLPTRSLAGDNVDPDIYPDEELTGEDAVALEACAEGEDTAYCTNPPYEYTAKFVCGVQNDPNTLRLIRGVYGTTVNIHNPWKEDAQFFKKVAVAFPPKEQAPGDILQMGKDRLLYDEALKIDCETIREKAFQGEFPTPYVEGFVVIQSFQSLDVTGVYTTGALVNGPNTCCGGNGQFPNVQHSGMEIVEVKERVKEYERDPGRDPDPEPGAPDLIPQPVFDPPPSDAPGTLPQNFCGRLAQGEPITDLQIHLFIRNQGDAPAGPSTTTVLFSPSEQLDPIAGLIDLNTPALAPDAAHEHVVDIPDRCFPGGGTGCSFRITADSAEPDVVAESDETNNVALSLCPGIAP